MNKLEIPGLIGNNCGVGNAHSVEVRESHNGSGDDAFGGARSWPTVWAEINFQSHEGQRAVALAKKLSELIEQEFGVVDGPQKETK